MSITTPVEPDVTETQRAVSESEDAPSEPRLIRDDPAWQRLEGSLAHLSDEDYELYLQCIREYKEERDREEAEQEQAIK